MPGDFGSVRRELIDLTKEYSELIRVEVLIGGFNDDARIVIRSSGSTPLGEQTFATLAGRAAVADAS